MVDAWERGISAGKEEGIQQGIAEGISQGISQGIAEGKAEGKEEGKAEGLQLSVLILEKLRAGIQVSVIAENYNVEPALVEQLKDVELWYGRLNYCCNYINSFSCSTSAGSTL